jgi:uncharacterized repeat protein (TIGR01451 family)
MKSRHLFFTVLFCTVLSCAATAQIVQPFAIYKQLTQRGDITFAANTVLTCTALCGAKDNAPPGSGQPPTGGAIANNGTWNNNNYTMVYVDGDGAPAFGGKTTFSSSRAFLDLSNNPGCSVIEAYLVWGGNILTTTSSYAKRDSVYMKVPGAATLYTGFKADYLIDNVAGSGTVPETQVTYQCYKNITNEIRAAGEGDYWVGNVVANTGVANMCGGWAIVVIYGDEALPLRNLTIYKGYANISSAAGGQNLTISGFFTPPNPASAVNIKLGVYAFEGDQGTIGDSLKFNNIAVANTKNYQNNFFNSSITNADTNTARLPLYVNTLGFDADIVPLANTTKNFLGNGASSASLRLTTAGDQYWPFLITTAIDVFEPNVVATKDWVDNNGGLVQLGDTITYNLKVRNRGTDPATNVILIDSIIGAMNYVPNSCVIVTGPNAGAKTDIAADDQVDVQGNIIKFRIGNGANGTAGGALGITAVTDSVTTMTFKVRIATDCQQFHCAGEVMNKAYVNFTGLSSGQGRTTLSSPNGLDAFGCPIQGATGFTVVVPPCTPVADTTLSVYCEPFALAAITTNRPGYTSFFNSSWVSVASATVNGTYYATKELFPGCSDTIAIFFTSTGNCIALPLNLVTFTAFYNNPGVTLNWATAYEYNTRRFIIERSTDGLHFETAGQVPASGNSSQLLRYRFVDANVFDVKKIHYRLRMADRDGTEKISGTVTVYTNGVGQGAEIAEVIPNPLKDKSAVRILSDATALFQYELINSNGQKVAANTVLLKQGVNDIVIYRNQLAKGVYVFKIRQQHSNAAVTKTILIE